MVRVQRGAPSRNGPLLALVLGCAFLLAASPASAAPALAKPKRTEGPEKMELSDGGVYSGATKGKKPHGVGRKLFPSGEVFEGEWADGVLHGAGMHKNAAGDTYKGGFVDGEREGQGVAEWDSGEKYRGGWKGGLRHGHGMSLLPTGESYEGGWVLGAREGKGEEKLESGETYRGQFRGGKRHGVGVVTYPDGRDARVLFIRGERPDQPPFADKLKSLPPRELSFDWVGSREHPDIMLERAQMDGRLDEKGRIMRKAGAFPLTTEDFPLESEPLSEARNGYSERELILSGCARSAPTAMNKMYDLFASGDFFKF